MASGRVAEFKACVAKIYTSNCTELDDRSVDIIPLFESIEKVFEEGLKESPSLFGEAQQYCWNVFERLPKGSKDFQFLVPYSVSMALEKVNECKRVKTAIGKGRLFLRILAKHGKLEELVLLLKENKPFLYEFYSSTKAALTNDVQCQIFYSFIADFTRIKFDLNVDNADFLDTTWEIPVYRTKNFVPCSHFGIRCRFLNSYYIITAFENGFCENEGFFELGDVITSLAGKVLRGKAVDLQKIVTKGCRTLLCFEIAKVRLPDGKLFKPIVNILKKEGLENLLDRDENADMEDKLASWPKTETLDLTKCYAVLGESAVGGGEGVPNLESEIIHSVRYVGSVDVGSHSDMSYISEAIDSVLAENPSPSCYMPVRVRLGELDVSVWPVRPDSRPNNASTIPFLRHAYPSISAVGHRNHSTRFLAYIVGNSTCAIATNFTAYVFLCLNRTEASRIVKGISNGFKRTNWTM